MDMPGDYRTAPEQENYTPFRAKLEFDLCDAQGQDELTLALYGKEAFFLLQELDRDLRNKLKYDETLTEEKDQVYEEIRDKLHNLMDECNLRFDMVS